MRVRKAVIPAAGFGTRVLPYTKSVPKEMISIVDKPAIQYIVEEAVNSGITDILLILSRGKTVVEDHFDRTPELEERLLNTKKTELYQSIRNISSMANITFIRQKEIKGLGHAILQAKNFVGDEPFAILYADDVIVSDYPVCKQLCDAYEESGKSVVGIKEVAPEEIYKYSSLKVENIKDNIFSVTDMIEKPERGMAFSNYSILGRCVLEPEIFHILEKTLPGAGGEIQLTDAMKALTLTKGMIGVDYVGKRYDMGNKLGILQANVEVGLTHPEVALEFAEYLKKMQIKL